MSHPERPGGRVSKGLARACESVLPTPTTPHTDPKGCTEGAPDVPEEGGVLEGGACPLLHRYQLIHTQRMTSARVVRSLATLFTASARSVRICSRTAWSRISWADALALISLLIDSVIGSTSKTPMRLRKPV